MATSFLFVGGPFHEERFTVDDPAPAFWYVPVPDRIKPVWTPEGEPTVGPIVRSPIAKYQRHKIATRELSPDGREFYIHEWTFYRFVELTNLEEMNP